MRALGVGVFGDMGASCGGPSYSTCVMVNPSLEIGEARARAAPATGDDLRGDAHRGLLGGARPEVEPDRRGQSLQRLLGDTGLPEPGEPVFVRAAGAHGSDVRQRVLERDLE